MEGISRARLLASATAIGVLGMPLLTAFVDAAQNASPDDIATLNTAIELERAGIKAYDDAAATHLLAPGVLAVALSFRKDHVAHRDALIAAVKAGGGVPSAATAKLEYPALKTQNDILTFAKTVEERAASTYLSVIPDFKDRKLAGVAASILGVETTHVALLAQALNELPAYPSAFVTQ
ncbi:MAG TPA: ferritin-like domain-containing protein [Candidatus Baltobacteraceae bacterium]|jgi:hypothetical protein